MSKDDDVRELRRKHVKGSLEHAEVTGAMKASFVAARMKAIYAAAPAPKRDKVRVVSATPVFAAPSRPGCDHVFEHVNDNFGRCIKCRLFCATSLGKLPKGMKKLPAILKDKELVPTDKYGRAYCDVIINKRLRVRRLWGRLNNDPAPRDLYELMVKFPKSWKTTMLFYEMKWDSIIKALRHCDWKNPLELFVVAQNVIYGRCWIPTRDLEYHGIECDEDTARSLNISLIESPT